MGKKSKINEKALRKREKAIAAEIAEREKAAKKARKKGDLKVAKDTPKKMRIGGAKIEKIGKGKKAKVRVVEIPEPTDAEARAAAAVEAAKAERARRRAELAAEKATPITGRDEMKAAVDRDLKAEKAEIDAEIKARVTLKRATRDRLIEEAKTVDRSDEEAVRAYNAKAVEVGAMLLTSDAEKAKMDEGTKPKKGKKAETFRDELRDAGKLTEANDHLDAALAADTIAEKAEHVEAAHEAMIAEVVETDHGREIVVGPVEEPIEFAMPSEAPRRLEDNTNGNGQYKIVGPDGKERGYTRVTTYISCLEDTTMLMKWKMRILLEGVAAIDDMVASGEIVIDEGVTARVRDLVHTRDVRLKKARKADRKGDLGIGQLEAITSAAWSEFKRGLDALADEAFEIGGGREKAAKGTDIHDLCALAVKDGIDAVGDKLTAGEITPADLADVEAFLAALDKLGAKVVGIEQVVVIDDEKIAGRLDYILMVKLPGMLRSTRLVADLKTGRVDLGTGKIAMQIERYSAGVGYDEKTGERTDLKLSRTKGLLLHLPAGSAKVTAHIVDLGQGRLGNKLAAEVRAWRNTSKKSIDLKTNLLDLVDAEAAAE